MKGRKPKPTALHELSGTLNATRHKDRKREPKAVGDLGAEPPEWMTDEQQAGWRYAVENAPAGVLKRIDRGMLATWIEAECRHRTATMMQAKLDAGSATPLLVKQKDGPLVVSPYIGILHKTALIMMKAGSELGFSPASRPRLIASEDSQQDEDDPWSGLQVIVGGKS